MATLASGDEDEWWLRVKTDTAKCGAEDATAATRLEVSERDSADSCEAECRFASALLHMSFRALDLGALGPGGILDYNASISQAPFPAHKLLCTIPPILLAPVTQIYETSSPASVSPTKRNNPGYRVYGLGYRV